MKRATLKNKIEEISDEFMSTFSATESEHRLVNMVGSTEFEELTEAIKKHVPDADLDFILVNDMGERSVYLIIDRNGEKKDSLN